MNKITKYKSTGLAWCPEIPEHWKLKRLKFNTYIKARVGWHGLNSSEFLYYGEFYLVTGTEFIDKNIHWEKCYRISEERYFTLFFLTSLVILLPIACNK